MQPSLLHPDAQSAILPSDDAPIRWTLLAKRTFGIAPAAVALKAKKQIPFAGADIHAGEPAVTPVRYESDFAPFKPVADALCVGSAYPPGEPAAACDVSFGVGKWTKTIRVFGDRDWVPRFGGLAIGATQPKPFETMAVSFENAFGGPNLFAPDGFDFYPQNRVGKGYARRGLRLVSLPLPLPLPNLEDPSHLIRGMGDRPAPQSFGPVGRTWQPRLAFAGTYDKAWLKHRSPKLPEDFNERYFNCAPQDQQIEGYLRGDEEIRVVTMHPQHHNLRCRLPAIRIRCIIERPHEKQSILDEAAMNLDTLFVDMDALQLILVWRCRLSSQALPPTSRVLLVEEPLGRSLPLESYRATFAEADAAQKPEPPPADSDWVIDPIPEPAADSGV